MISTLAVCPPSSLCELSVNVSHTAFWPTYNLKNKKVLQIKKDNVTLISDDFNLGKTDFLNSAKVLDEFEK
jgi:hypothetical protein